MTRTDAPPQTTKVAVQLLQFGLVAAFLLGLVAGAIELAQDYFEERRNEEKLIENILQLSVAGAVQAAFQLDSGLGQDTIQPLLIYEFITSATIVDDTGAVRADVSRDPVFTAYDAFTAGFLPIKRNYHADLLEMQTNTHVGRLNIEVHTNTILRQFYSRAWRVIATSLFKNVLLTIILLTIFHFVLSRPLAALLKAMEKADPRHPRPLALSPAIQGAGNEISEIATTMNVLLDSSRVHLDELRDEQEKTGRMTQQLHHSERLRALGQLVGGVAHDFNNILAIIVGTLDILRLKGIAGDSRKFLDTARHAAKKGAALTGHLLTFARERALSPELIDPKELFAEIAKLLPGAVGGHHNVSFAVATGAWTIHADREQLETVIMNLVLNARDAMPDGGEISVRARNVTAGASDGPTAEVEQLVAITVADQGKGMDKDVLARAFEPFFSTKPEGQGTGLGLSMAHGFATQSGGRIEIQSDLGVGTRVEIYLPRARGQTEEEPRGDDQDDQIDLSGLRIFVVDDNANVRDMLVRMLQSMSAETLEAEDAAQALNMIQYGATADLFLLDVLMPGGVNGIELARQIRLLRDGRANIGFVSGYTKGAINKSHDDDVEAILLKKPFTRAELGRFVKKLLGAD